MFFPAQRVPSKKESALKAKNLLPGSEYVMLGLLFNGKKRDSQNQVMGRIRRRQKKKPKRHTLLVGVNVDWLQSLQYAFFLFYHLQYSCGMSQFCYLGFKKHQKIRKCGHLSERKCWNDHRFLLTKNIMKLNKTVSDW